MENDNLSTNNGNLPFKSKESMWVTGRIQVDFRVQAEDIHGIQLLGHSPWPKLQFQIQILDLFSLGDPWGYFRFKVKILNIFWKQHAAYTKKTNMKLHPFEMKLRNDVYPTSHANMTLAKTTMHP